jgi:hypothetical protein
MKSSYLLGYNTGSPLKIKRQEYVACCLLHAGIFLGLFFNPEDGSDMFLRNTGRLSTDYMMLYSRNRTLHNYCCENLKSHTD